MNPLLQARQNYAAALAAEEALLAKLVSESRDASSAEKTALETYAKKKQEALAFISQMEDIRAERICADQGLPLTPENLAAARAQSQTPSLYIPGQESYSPASGELAFRDVQSGQVYRALRPSERLASQAVSQEDRLSPGLFIRGALVGRWDGAERERRAYDGNVGASGGFLIPTVLSNMFVDAARNKARVIQAGALTLPVPNREVVIAAVENDDSAHYKQENAKATAAEMTFTTLTLHARTLCAYAVLSEELLQDAVNIDNIIVTAFAEAIGLAMDRAALFGSGAAGEPLGLFSTDGVQIVNPNENGFNFSNYDTFSSAITAIEGANGEAVSAIYSPRTAAQLRELKELTTGAYLPEPAFFSRLKRFSTNQIPNDLTHGTEDEASCAFLGDFSQFLFGIRQQLKVDVSREAGETFERNQFALRATLRFDSLALRPAHFAIVKGIKPTA